MASTLLDGRLFTKSYFPSHEHFFKSFVYFQINNLLVREALKFFTAVAGSKADGLCSGNKDEINISFKALFLAGQKLILLLKEVHKHPHHVTHKKKWGEYLLEFFEL